MLSYELAPDHFSAPCSFLFFTDTATPAIYTLSLHDALPISATGSLVQSTDHPNGHFSATLSTTWSRARSEEHTSELQSRQYLVCRLLLEKKKKKMRSVTRSQ